MISLRPAGMHGGLRRAAARLGARVFALPPWRLVALDDAGTRRTLAAALDADVVVFTSPAAVRAARALQPLAPACPAQDWLAVGATTAAALRRAGIGNACSPVRMTSEGLLALPALADVRGRRVGLVTAPGGRGVLAPALAAGGAEVLRADVYTRQPVTPGPARLAALMQLPDPWLLPLSSAEALERTLATLPEAAAARLLRAGVVAASPRLAARAQALGFRDVRCANDARPAPLLQAAMAPRPAS
nr:uroporphyrinogen-III synthase [Luteimonas deserti]